MFALLQGKLTLILFGIIAGLGLYIFIFHSITQKKIETLQANNAKLEQAVEIQNHTIDVLQKSKKVQDSAVVDLQKKFSKTEEEKNKLMNLLREHDIEAIGRQKPELLEEKINEATKKFFSDLETSTGGGK